MYAPFDFRPGFFGIRRLPYSIDRSKNPTSFKHIADANAMPDVASNAGPSGAPNSEVHNAGEIWATMLWEVYNVLIDEHSRSEARRRMSDYVVAGLLLTPPEATFTEGRDAILAAAGALDVEDMLLMAAAFAGRGAGTCAVSPDASSANFNTVVESGSVAAKLETSGVSLTDDGVSCDSDGYLDPGESGTLHITVANSGVIAAEDITVRAKTTTQGVTLGKRIKVNSIAPLTHIDVEIPVSLKKDAPTSATLDIAITIEGDAGCDTSNLVVGLQQRMGVDEAPAVSTTDDVETKLVAWTPTGAQASDLWGRFSEVGDNHVLFGFDAPFISDTQLVSPVLQASMTEPLVVSFKHAYALEAFALFGFFFDGGVIEVSNDNGMTWRDVTEVGVDPGYTGTLLADFENPLGNRDAFSGFNDSIPATEAVVLNFGTQFAGQAVQVRFRIGTDNCCAAQGWLLDDFSVTGVTNTPFPGFVAETNTCSGAPSASAGGIMDERRAPRTSLDGVPGASEEPEEP